MIKIDKRKARNLYDKGVSIYLLPCKIPLNNPWYGPYEININDYPDKPNSFDWQVNAYEYYNCQYNELGYYASYYVKEGSFNE